MESQIGAMIVDLLTEYGSLGMAMAVTLYFLNEIKRKLDVLLEINNRSFGLLISLVDKTHRSVEESRVDDATHRARGDD